MKETQLTDRPELGIDDAIVLLLGAAEDPNDPRAGELSGITRLEKLIFLLERETEAAEWLTEKGDFVAHNFGPFSSKVYQAVDLLAAAGIVVDSGAASDNTEDTWESANLIGSQLADNNPYATRDFKLTERGWRYFEALKQEMSAQDLSELATFKKRFARLPLRQLVRYVYQRYESFTEKSVIRQEILGY